VRTRLDEDHDGRVTREYLFNYLQLVEPIHEIRGSSGAALSQQVGAGAQTTRGSPGAPLRWEPEPQGHAAPPELPCAGRQVLELSRHVATLELP
jgi:hypothetical protein